MTLARGGLVVGLAFGGTACSDGDADTAANTQTNTQAGIAAAAARGTLLVGYYTKDSFDDLEQVPDCPVLWGLQGGNWTMPTLRTQNFDDAVTAKGTLLLGDEMIGTAQAQA
ncbi:MAG TPA: hypothetical protein VL137_17435, partial [Polyangiaceae bacterium]|nr:hypothetical protein [Polyangiaceae bacterium]